LTEKNFQKALFQPWRECIDQAWEAYKAGSFPIGAIITDKNGRTVAHGRNRNFETTAPAPYLCNVRMAHAEINALLAFSQTGLPFEGTTLYTSLEPCPMCLGATRMYRLGGIAYAARDSVAGSIALAHSTHFFQASPLTIQHPPDPAIERALLILLAEAMLRLTPGRWVQWREEQDEAHPTTLKIGRTLHPQHADPDLIQSQSFWDILPNLL
jgi:tRNA(adenine34) deaminase